MPRIVTQADRIIRYFSEVRATTERLAAPLSAEDQQLQSMPDCSPTKWHRAHTTWFFETFILQPSGIAPYDARLGYLYNSYYEAVGPRHARSRRGMVSRPTAEEIGAYRRAVDGRVVELLTQLPDAELDALRPVLELGLAHEQQHQELILTDILHAFSENPLLPAYAEPDPARPKADPVPLRFEEYAGGLVELGAPDDSSFAFDNEQPRHRRWVDPFGLASRLVTVGEMRAFLRDGGYSDPSLWMSEGIDWVRAHHIRAPAYARYEDGAYVVFGLTGSREARDDEPVTHVSYYEADAIARFLGARLPTEVEWEVAAAGVLPDGNFLEDGGLRALPARGDVAGPRQLFGDAWEWTRSSYEPYPGYRPGPGALGEYNGKFMVSQIVLRGGSALTPRGHVRPTYRNFWYPATRFQLTGIRLATTLR